jgi:hypothetical protein
MAQIEGFPGKGPLEQTGSWMQDQKISAGQDRLIAGLERIAGVSIDDAIIPAAGLADAATNGQQLK